MAEEQQARVKSEHPRGFARVLLQVVLPPDSANDLAYVSTDWKAERTAPPVGHEHVDWKDVSFMDAYQALKNTAHGDKVTARVLLKRGWGFAPFDMSESVKIVATSMAFADPDFQYRRHHLRATTAAMTDVELTEHPLRA